MKQRIRILTTNCKRCGKPLATLSRSLYGAEQAKAQYEGICQDCVLPDERQEINNLIAEAILEDAKC
jgi:hypothetical protein